MGDARLSSLRRTSVHDQGQGLVPDPVTDPGTGQDPEREAGQGPDLGLTAGPGPDLESIRQKYGEKNIHGNKNIHNFLVFNLILYILPLNRKFEWPIIVGFIECVRDCQM